MWRYKIALRYVLYRTKQKTNNNNKDKKNNSSKMRKSSKTQNTYAHTTYVPPRAHTHTHSLLKSSFVMLMLPNFAKIGLTRSDLPPTPSCQFGGALLLLLSFVLSFFVRTYDHVHAYR